VKGTVIAVCVSRHKGVMKKNVGSALMEAGHGIRDDAHAGDWHRQVSLISAEDIELMKNKGLDVAPGSFAENLTTQGFDLGSLKLGDRVRVGEKVTLEITQIGKECHTKCAIFHKVGECIMPERGIFTKVLDGGEVKVGDEIQLVP
jgi:MOSC domain-containing protein YiiM